MLINLFNLGCGDFCNGNTEQSETDAEETFVADICHFAFHSFQRAACHPYHITLRKFRRGAHLHWRSGPFDNPAEIRHLFFGHDHLNNMSLRYKGITLSYGYTVDYLAYKKIETYGRQRGCTMITVSPDGTFTVDKENYYQEKYVPVGEKEKVTMEKYYQ